MAFQIGDITIDDPLFLSPMAGFTNLPFRACVRSLGGLSVTTTDFVNARSLIELNSKAIQLIATCSDDRPYGVQLFGGNPQELRDASRFLEDLGVNFIDINMGCPAPKVNKSGGGAALMQDEELTEDLIEAIVTAVKIPVTVKMRLGWDEKSINAHVIAPRLEAMGVAAVAVHGRTREQGYEGTVNIEGIRAVVQSVKKIPVIGNGDVHTQQDAERMIKQVGCKAVMVGRAALKNPFFFRRTAHYLRTGEELPTESLEEKILFMHRHFYACIRYLGEEEACVQFRKVVVGYSSFFEHSRVWRISMHDLSSVNEYWEAVGQLCPRELPEDCRDRLAYEARIGVKSSQSHELSENPACP
jgi:nifR3 family TIM-barrel protein